MSATDLTRFRLWLDAHVVHLDSRSIHVHERQGMESGHERGQLLDPLPAS